LPNNIPSAQDFLDFFNKKVEAVGKETGQGLATTFLPPAAATFSKLSALHRRRRSQSYNSGSVEVV